MASEDFMKGDCLWSLENSRILYVIGMSSWWLLFLLHSDSIFGVFLTPFMRFAQYRVLLRISMLCFELTSMKTLPASVDFPLKSTNPYSILEEYINHGTFLYVGNHSILPIKNVKSRKLHKAKGGYHRISKTCRHKKILQQANSFGDRDSACRWRFLRSYVDFHNCFAFPP